MGLLGTAFVGLVVVWPPPERLVVWGLPLSWLMAMIGCAGITRAQLLSDRLSVRDLMPSSVGHHMLIRAAPCLEIAVPITLVLVTVGLARRLGLAAVCVTTAVAMLGDVYTSHAGAAHSWKWLWTSVQWGHFLAVGVWIGGLAALLICLPGMDPRARATGVRRYSTVAGIALFTVAGSGALRSVDEVGSWGRLLSTGFGQLVVAKIGVVMVLAGLGAINRFRNVRSSGRTVTALRRVSALEIGLAAGALLATALLQNLAPVSTASAASGARPPAAVAVYGADAGTTTRAALKIDPGPAGFNRFDVNLADYDSRAPVALAQVTLRFDLPGRPDIGASVLVLVNKGRGDYQGQGGNLAVQGSWTVTILVQRDAGGIEIPLTVPTRDPASPMSM
jgi:copper transport protein